MKLVVFKAGDGDSLLIQGKQANILVDGGRKGQFEDYVAPALEALHNDNKELDLVCVSHIDDDHITGIVELYRRLTEWTVHRAMEETTKKPKFGEPPKIKQLWHNGFGETFSSATAASTAQSQLGFHEQLISSSAVLAETSYGQRYGRIAQGAKKAIELQLRFAQSPMDIKFNKPADGDLLHVKDQPQTIEINGIEVFLLGPFETDFDRLRGKWDAWVAANEDKVDKLKDKFKLQSSSSNALDFLAFAAKQAELGEFNDITPPNLVSIMFLLQEGDQKILMTGDGASQGKEVAAGELPKHGVLEGLEHAGLVQPGGGIHVNILKVPHHGAVANTSNEFARRVTADHYVFCANGRHHNPEVDVIDAYMNARLGPAGERSTNPEVGDEFNLWFNYHPEDSEIASNDNYKEQMNAAKERVEKWDQKHPGRFNFEFSRADSIPIDLNNQ